MNSELFTEILTKHGFRVEKEIAPWSGGSDWFVAYTACDKFNVAVAAYDPEDADIATISILLKKTAHPDRIKIDKTKDVRTAEELEQACMELNEKYKKMLEQIKLEQINSDF